MIPTSVRVVSQYAVGAVLIRLADEGARLALVLLALDRINSARVGGALVAALLVPQVVAAPVVGLITDRARAPRLVIGAAALGFAGALLTTALGLGRVPLALTLIVLVTGGCCGPALTGGLTSQLSGVVNSDFLPRAFGIDSLTYNVSGIAGPALVAVISGFASPATALVVLGALAATGGVVVAGLPLAGRERSAMHQKPRLADALRLLTRDRNLGLVTAATTVGQAGLGALPVVVVVLSNRAHAASASGWLLTASAVGALLGSISWILRPASPRQAPALVMASLILMGTPLAVAAASPAVGLTAALFLVSGFFFGPLAGALFTTRQEHAPEALRAQVFTLGAGLKITAAAAGVATAGALAQLPTATLLLVTAACPILAGALGALGLRVSHTGGHAPTEPPSPGGVRGDRRRSDGTWRHPARVGQRR